MSAITARNKAFEIDLTNKDKECSHMDTRVIVFHIECAVKAFDGNRYYPDPQEYVKWLTNDHKQRFISIARDASGLLDCLKSSNKFTNIISKYKIQDFYCEVLINFISFTLLSCSLTLTDVSRDMPHFQSAFRVTNDNAKERQFASVPSSVSYWLHTTNHHSLYSICRNGIQSMSGLPGFQCNGRQFGVGVYLRQYGHQAVGGDVQLCFAVKNASRFSCNNGHYCCVNDMSALCLRAIVVGENYGYEREIIDCVQRYN